jgi:hypothetical protein
MLLDSLIILSCSGFYGQQNDACQKALQAGSKQNNVEQSMGSYEQNHLYYLQSGTESTMGEDATHVMVGTGLLAVSMIKKKAAFGLPNFGICDGIKFEWSSGTERLLFQWKF